MVRTRRGDELDALASGGVLNVLRHTSDARLAAYGLTAREREICSEVIAGYSTADISGRLFISSNTVQDHLKSIFSKVGVRSRGELVARLRPNFSAA